MKKYFVAAAIAIAVFAMSAFAASLTVNGDFLQAGVDPTLKCTNDAVVTYNTSNDYNGHWLGGVTVTTDPACEGQHAQVALLTQAPGWPNHQLVYAISTNPIDANGSADIDFMCNGTIRVADVNTVQVLIKKLTAAETSALPFASCNPLP
jgi:hypothetical protein